jgi:hypothetical protein
MPKETAGWTVEEAWDALGRIRDAIELTVPTRLLGTGEGAEPTLDREVLALVRAIHLMNAHMPEQLDEAVLAEARAWSGDTTGIGSAVVEDGDPSPGTGGIP